MNKSNYFIISLTHTFLEDKYISFWGPGENGYRQEQSKIGAYQDIKESYHGTAHPVFSTFIEHLFQDVPGVGSVIINDAYNREKLGIEIDEDGQHDFKISTSVKSVDLDNIDQAIDELFAKQQKYI